MPLVFFMRTLATEEAQPPAAHLKSPREDPLSVSSWDHRCLLLTGPHTSRLDFWEALSRMSSLERSESSEKLSWRRSCSSGGREERPSEDSG